MTRYLLLLALLAFQVTSATRTVTVKWTLPKPTATWQGCTATMPTCYYVVYRTTTEALAESRSKCPSIGSNAYVPLNAANPTTALQYVDTTAPARGGVCYYARTIQSQVDSAPSNVRMF
jgi:hypothetical protein